MISKNNIAVMVMVVLIAVMGMVPHAISNTTLDAQKMSELYGMGCCEDTLSCQQCTYVIGKPGSSKCTFTLMYYECVNSPGTNKACGTCVNWGVNCGVFQECTDSNCANCVTTGSCSGCNQLYPWGDEC